MPKVDREGWFRAIITDGGVSATKKLKPEEREDGSTGELPQLVGSFLMQELYDDATDAFQDCSEYGETIDGYLVLRSHAGEDMFNRDDAMEVFNWDGQSYHELDEKLIKAVNDKQLVMIHVEEDTYENKTSLKVQGIRRADAQPGGSVKKLNSSELKKLDAKYKRKAKPTKATPASKPVADKKKPTTPKKAAAPKKAPPAKTEAAPGSCTKDDAWDFVCNEELWDKNTDQDKVNDAWTTVVAETGPDEDKFTAEDWFVIRDAVSNKVFSF